MADSNWKSRIPFPVWNKFFKAPKPPATSGDIYTTLYSKLDATSRSIRLITLLPGTWSEEISCRLYVSQLPSTQLSTRPYKALSYAWKNNDGAEDVPISINGRVVTISNNLFSAMRRLRHRIHKPFDIWIDSLCINQTDDAERTHQVSLMREIYRNSEEVIIWLGESSIQDDLGQALLPEIYPHRAPTRSSPPTDDHLVTVEWFGDERDRPKLAAYIKSVAAEARSVLRSPGMRDIFGAFCVVYLLSQHVPASEIWHLRHFEYSTPIIRGLYALMDQQWWRRTWVVQETVVAQNATIYYGRMSAPWVMFSRAALEYDRTQLLSRANSVYPYLRDGRPLAHFARTVLEVESTRRLWEGVNTSLLPLLRDFRSRDATDERDKVFALIGLVRNWGRGIKVNPDYSMKPDRVLWETTTRLIAGTRSLSVLAGTLQQNSSKWALNPSWITDWSCPPKMHESVRMANLHLYDAAKELDGYVKAHGRWTLETAGYHVDSVLAVGQELPAGTDGPNNRLRMIVSEWQRLLERLGSESYISGGSVTDAFWRLLCGDTEYHQDIGEDQVIQKIGFRRATQDAVDSYHQWRAGNRQALENRRTSIIAGYWLESGGGDEVRSKNAFHHAVECASGDRRIFITHKGYIGTAPDHIREGDDVFILYKSRVPFILRLSDTASTCQGETREVLIEDGGSDEPDLIPLTEANRNKLIEASQQQGLPMEVCNEVHEHCYHVVGDAYVHGIMDGEAIPRGEAAQSRPRSVFLI